MPGSKACRLILTEEAVLDLDRLDLFLRPINPVAADRFQDLIWSALQRLMAQPRTGRLWPMTPHQQDIRELFITFGKRPYVVRYRIDGAEIVIARIHHSREDR